MAIGVKKNQAFGVMAETTEGVYVAPSSAAKFVQALEQGADIAPAKQLLKRSIFTGSIGETSPLTGQFEVSGNLPVEARANSVEGTAPEYDLLVKGALGNSRSISTTTTTKTGNSGTVLQIQDADISKFNVGDMILIKEAGAYHVSPIASKTTGAGTATITLLAAKPTGSFSDNVVIAKSTTYIVADSGHPSLSISKYIDGTILEKAVGCKVKSMALSGFATGQIPSLKFGFEGLTYDRTVTSIPFTPAYDTSLPPILLDGRLYMDGTSIDVNDVTLQLDNALGFQTSIAAPNGRTSSRATERTIKGTLNPYKPDDSVANYTKYANNTPFSLFAYAKVPTGVAGEFNQIVAIYMPNCLITDITEADNNGLLQDNIAFQASRGTAGTTPEIYISFI